MPRDVGRCSDRSFSSNSRRRAAEEDENVIEDSQAKLYVACQRGEFAIARRCVKYGADPDRPNEHGFTPLFLACENGHFDVALFLVRDCGADVDEGASASGRTPLHEACYGGHLELCKMLLAFGAMLIEDEDGDTPLQDAESEGHAEIVELIMEHKARAAAARQELPDGWEEVFDPESGQYFYFHEASEATQWERPVAERPATTPASPERPDSTGFLGV